MPLYRAMPRQSGYIVEWRTEGPTRGYDQWPALWVRHGTPVFVEVEHLQTFRALIRVPGVEGLAPLDFNECQTPDL